MDKMEKAKRIRQWAIEFFETYDSDIIHTANPEAIEEIKEIREGSLWWLR